MTVFGIWFVAATASVFTFSLELMNLAKLQFIENAKNITLMRYLIIRLVIDRCLLFRKNKINVPKHLPKT